MFADDQVVFDMRAKKRAVVVNMCRVDATGLFLFSAYAVAGGVIFSRHRRLKLWGAIEINDVEK